MMQRMSIAIGAGLAAALLFAAMAKGTLLAMLLAYFTPLPIMIATLGWGLDMGALAGAIAIFVVAALIDPLSGVTFAASIALPAWMLSFVALLPRGRLYPLAPSRDGEEKWFPVGGIVAVGALIGAGVSASAVFMYGGFEKSVASLAAELAPSLREALGGVMTLPAGISVEDFAVMIVRLLPAALAAMACLVFCANLYAGARAVQVSARLKRPWSNLPEALVLPQFLGIALIACAGLALTLRGSGAYVAWIGIGALGCAYVMQGLAVVHSLSRGLPVRIAILFGVYLTCLVTARWSLPALAIVGLIESLASLRARRAAAAGMKS